MAAYSEHSQNTLFVRNLPFFTTDDKFEELFGDIGPLKRCFVVRDKGVTDKCRGFGYVTFASREDAEKAVHANKSLNGRKLVVKFADKKNVKKTDKPKKKEQIHKNEESEDKDENQNENKEDEAPKDISHVTTRRTLVIKNLAKDTTKEDVIEMASKTENVEGVKFPVSKEEENIAYVRYKFPLDANTAKPMLKKVKLNGVNLDVVLLACYNPTVSQTTLKKGRLIIRNLSFKCRENDLLKTFEKFGEISEVSIPRKGNDNDRIIGFGFVQFVKVKAAKKAVKEMNAKEILGRKVAVDWSLPKQKYDAITGNNKKETKEDSSAEESNDEDDGTDLEDSDGSVENEESSDEEEEEAEDEEEEDEEDDKDDNEMDTDEDVEEDESDGNDEASDEEQMNRVKESISKPTQNSTFKRQSDVSAGKTVFVRNIPFEITADDLEELFEEYGEVNYCRLVIDPNTERLRGSAFVQFNSQDSAEECIATSETESGIVFKNRRLQLNLALSREEATKLRTLEKDKEKVKSTDKRNLYLLREGMIRPGTQAAEGLSEAEMKKRTNLEQVKRNKLKNLNVFVSATRLAIHNLPVSVDKAKLRGICIKAIGKQKSTVTEARIMRDLTRKNSLGVCKSLGYGFVGVDNHENALKLLNFMNNNKELFGPKKRPIVGFSLENKSALELKEKRRQKSQNISIEKRKNESKNEVEHKGTPSVKRQKITNSVTSNLEDSTFVERKLQAKKQGLPKHIGAKERWRDRGKQVKTKKGQQRSGATLQKPTNVEEKQKKRKKVKISSSSRRNKGKDEEKNFNKLVESYKRKISDVTKERKVTSKWFE